MLAADYITSRHPVGLRRLVLADSPASMEALDAVRPEAADAHAQVKHATPLSSMRSKGRRTTRSTRSGVMVFYKKHLCTVDPWPETLMEAFNTSEEDKTVYYTMYVRLFREMELWHTSLTTCQDRPFRVYNHWLTEDVVGYWKAGRDQGADINHERRSRMRLRDEVIKPFLDEIPNNKWVKFKKSSHMAFYEERQTYIKVLADFLS